jgi:hypothetical protein
MVNKMKCVLPGLVLVGAFVLGTGSVIPTHTPQGIGISIATVASADDGCDGPHPPPGLDCPEPTPTATPTPRPGN